MKLRTALLSILLGGSALSIPVLVVGAAGASSSGCTPTQSAEFGTLGQLVLSDVAAGKTLAQIESDVAQALFGNTTVTNQIVAIVNNLLQLLLNAVEGPTPTPGLTIPAPTVAVMKSMVVSLQAQMATFAPKN